MRQKFIYIITVLVTLFIGVSGTIYFYNKFTTKETSTCKSQVEITETNSLAPAVDKVYDAVVVVKNFRGNTLQATGTGFIYKQDGEKAYVMTNHHVVENGSKFTLLMSDGAEIDATVIGSDVYADIAVMSIDKKNVKVVAEMGESTSSKLGDTVFTVGSPLGSEYQGTVTRGILSGKNRMVSVTLSNGNFMMDVLQTDAAINEGNSGGPLLNSNGQVIGVNSMKIATNTIEGMGFAIPIETALSTAEKLEKGETIKRPLFGVTMIELNQNILYRYDIEVDKNLTEGVVIAQVEKDSPAEKAGLKKGDVIISMDNVSVKNSAYFRYLLYKYNVNDEITVKYNRSGKEEEVKVKLNKSLEG